MVNENGSSMPLLQIKDLHYWRAKSLLPVNQWIEDFTAISVFEYMVYRLQLRMDLFLYGY